MYGQGGENCPVKRPKLEVGAFYRSSNGKIVVIVGIRNEGADSLVEYRVLSLKKRTGIHNKCGQSYEVKSGSFIGHYYSKLGFDIKISGIW